MRLLEAVFGAYWRLVLAFRRLESKVWDSRWQRRLGGCGQGVSIKGKPILDRPEHIVLEDNVSIGPGAFIRAMGGLHIGANTHIGRNFTVITANHNYEGDCLPYDSKEIRQSVCIGRNVWIGINVNIIPGITVGDGAIVGMGSVVASDIPPLAIVGGAPAEIIGWRDRSRYERLDLAGLYGGKSGERIE